MKFYATFSMKRSKDYVVIEAKTEQQARNTMHQNFPGEMFYVYKSAAAAKIEQQGLQLLDTLTAPCDSRRFVRFHLDHDTAPPPVRRGVFGSGKF